MGILQDREKRSEEIRQGRFIHSRLEETAKEINKLQQKAMSGFKSEFWNNRTFSVSGGKLVHQHHKAQRFLDMKSHTGKDGNRQRKKSRVVHNKIIWGKYNYLVRELAFGYSEAVKEEFSNMED